MADDSPTQYVVEVSFQVKAQGQEDQPACLEQNFKMRNLNVKELLAVDGELLKFYTQFMGSLKELAAMEGLYLDIDA